MSLVGAGHTRWAPRRAPHVGAHLVSLPSRCAGKPTAKGKRVLGPFFRVRWPFEGGVGAPQSSLCPLPKHRSSGLGVDAFLKTGFNSQKNCGFTLFLECWLEISYSTMVPRFLEMGISCRRTMEACILAAAAASPSKLPSPRLVKSTHFEILYSPTNLKVRLVFQQALGPWP